MSTKVNTDADACGCCEPASAATPAVVENRPGLPDLRYRIGTYASFRQAMLEAISRQGLNIGGELQRPLQRWTARDAQDHGIACLSMWAYLGDILTFYQERIANEAFLSTARSRELLVRLAKLVDYRPGPGRAASVDLAFSLEQATELEIPKGLRVQSIPGPGEKPQKFETRERITGDAELNQLRVYPKPKPREPLGAGSTWGILDPELGAQLLRPLVAGDQLVMFDEQQAYREEKRVEALTAVDWSTQLSWSPPVGGDPSASSSDAAVGPGLAAGKVYRWRRKRRLFGHNAPEEQLKGEPDSRSPSVLKWTTLKTDFAIDLDAGQKIKTLSLDGVYDDVKTGMVVLVATPELMKLTRVADVQQAPAHLYELPEEAPRPTGGTPEGPILYLDERREVLSTTVTQITLSEALEKQIQNLRKVTLYELEDPEISFWKCAYREAGVDGQGPSAAQGADMTVPEAGSLKRGTNTFYVPKVLLSSLEKGRAILLDDAEQDPQRVQVTAIDIAKEPADGACNQ